MNVSYKWLKDYIDLDLNVEKLSDILTFSGIEVEGINEIKALPETVITALIRDVEDVPKSDHLHLCKIDIGDYSIADPSLLNADGTLDVVCGAPNCRAGMKVVLALPGTALADVTIKSAKLRGVMSHGMLCSEREIGLSNNHDGIIELGSDTPLGISINPLYELPDTVFELEITPNRSDLLGYLGIARDLSASLDLEVKPPVPVLPESDGTAPLLLINEEPTKCYRYIARVFDNIEIKPSPLWLKTRLTKAGLRPINNLVDITNYVLLTTGHPLHAFDYDKLAKQAESDAYPAIIIRNAKPDESILALDSKVYSLRTSDLVIADGTSPSAIAGVMGGETTGVSSSTKRIVLESAIFNHSAVRKTSYELKVSSDSSYRFERHLSDIAPDYASQLASVLISELCGGVQIGNALDLWDTRAEERILGLRPDRYIELIGYPLSDEEIRTYLTRLGLVHCGFGTWMSGNLTAEQIQSLRQTASAKDCVHYYRIPHYRIDLEREIDLIEELARLAGYDRIPQVITEQVIMDRHHYRIKRKVEDYLVSEGLFEVLNYSFEDPQNMLALGFNEDEFGGKLVNLVNPQSVNQGVMRLSLIPSVIANIAYNLNRGERNLKLFETAKVYCNDNSGIKEENRITAILTGMDKEESWKYKQTALTFFHLKGIISGIIDATGLSNVSFRSTGKPYLMSDESIGIYSGDALLAEFGRMDPRIAESFGIDTITLKQDIWLIDISIDNLAECSRGNIHTFSLIPKFPSVVRDLSFIIEDSVKFEDLKALIKSVDESIIEDVVIFDEYRSKQLQEGTKSVSLHVMIRDTQKTLTDERVDTLVDSVLKLLKDKLHISLR